MNARSRVIFAAILVLGFASAGAEAGNETVAMMVQVASTQIRSSPSAVAPILATISYRQRLFVFGTMEGWTKVRVPGSSRYGYVFASALTAKPIPAVVTGTAASGVSPSEISLAGKGFDQRMEEEYKTSSKLDFFWVETMEKYSYSPEDCLRFLGGGEKP